MIVWHKQTTRIVTTMKFNHFVKNVLLNKKNKKRKMGKSLTGFDLFSDHMLEHNS